MNVEELFASFVRQMNRHEMTPLGSGQSRSLPAPEPGEAYLLYLHIPHCIALCPFCSFHRVLFDRDNATPYFESLRREIELTTDAGYRFDEIYVGGGTPTVLPDELVATLDAVQAKHAIRNISVETNPNQLHPELLSSLRDAQVSRLSVGVQSFDDDLLKAMQRFDNYGSGAEITARLKDVHGMFDSINVDMIFNLPNQTEASLKRDLDILIDELAADQVSFYPLMSNDTNKNEMSRTMGNVDVSRQHDFYTLIAENMLAAGYSRVSAWCFSRKPGMFDEYIVEREHYVGLGSGAFSYLKGALFANTFSISAYMDMVQSGRGSITSMRQLSEQDQKRYYLLIRLFGGSIDKLEAETRFGGRFQSGLWVELAALGTIKAIRDTGESLVLTERGYQLWVVLMREFFGETNRFRDQVRHEQGRPMPPQQSTESTNDRARTDI